MEFEEFDEDSMPVTCRHCNKWIDLNDGYGSQKWYPNIIICDKCYEEEEAEIERENEISELLDQIADAKVTLSDCYEQLEKLNYYDHKTGQ